MAAHNFLSLLLCLIRVDAYHFDCVHIYAGAFDCGRTEKEIVRSLLAEEKKNTETALAHGMNIFTEIAHKKKSLEDVKM